jgi:predicted acyltransferase (DUF342 family)
MPGYFQTALYDGHYFTNTTSNDVILRASSNVKLHIGVGEEVVSRVTLTDTETFFNDSLILDELKILRANFKIIDGLEFINFNGVLNINSNLLNVNNSNKCIHINNSNIIDGYQLVVNSNIYTNYMNVANTLKASNIELTGNLNVFGSINTTNVKVTEIVTDKIVITNNGTDTALEIIQTGQNDIASFYDDNEIVLSIKDEGFVGICTNNPSYKLHVNGDMCVEERVIMNSNLIINGPIFRIPLGVEENKPDASITSAGSLYFNTTKKRFEGIQLMSDDTNAWMPLGGLIDDNGDTYISAVDIYQKNNDILYFHASNNIVPVATMNRNLFNINLDVNIQNSLSIGSNVTLSSQLSVYDTIYSHSNVIIENSLSIGSNVTLSSQLSVYDTIYSHSNVIIENSLSIGSNVTLSSQLSVYDTIYSHSNVIIENSLSIGSNVTLSSQLSVYDTIYSHSNVIIENSLSIGSNVTLSSQLSVYDTIYSHSNVVIENSLSIGSNVTLSSQLSVASNVTLSRQLSVYDTIYSHSNVVIHNTLSVYDTIFTKSNIVIGGMLSVYDTLFTSNLCASNIQYIGDYTIDGNFTCSNFTACNLKIRDTFFPLIPNVNDMTKILAVNNEYNYELLTLYNENNTCEFKSLFGKFQTGIELEQISGMFDFGIPKYWIGGWRGRLFEGGTENDTALIPAPNGLYIDEDNISLLEDLTTSNMDFRDFINISYYKTNGDRLIGLKGIAVNSYINPNYYFLLDTIDPNHEYFRHKFKNDFETFYNERNIDNKENGYIYGYSVDLESINIPHHNLHQQGTMFFVVEFIVSYDNCLNKSENYQHNNKYAIPQSYLDRKNKYYVTDDVVTDDVSFQYVSNSGLYPHITYRKWKNTIKSPLFSEKLYDEDIGWGWPDVTNIYNKFNNNGKLFKLYKMTVNYIYNGKTNIDYIHDDLYSIYTSNVTNASNYNIIMNSNIHSNDNNITNNINSFCFSKDAFPDSLF